MELTERLQPAHCEVSLKESYRKKIIAIYAVHNEAKLGEVDGLLERYAGKERLLYEGVCTKYLGGVPDEDSQKPATLSSGNNKTHAGSFGFSSLGSFGASLSSTGAAGFLQSGLSTLHGLQGAAEGLREKVEKSFDDAIRSEEDTSTLEIMQKVTAIGSGESGSGRLSNSLGRPQSSVGGLSDKAGVSAVGTRQPILPELTHRHVTEDVPAVHGDAEADILSDLAAAVGIGAEAGAAGDAAPKQVPAGNTHEADAVVGSGVEGGAAEDAPNQVPSDAAMAGVVAAPQDARAASDVETAEPLGVQVGEAAAASVEEGTAADAGRTVPSDSARFTAAALETTRGPDIAITDVAETIGSAAAVADSRSAALANFRAAVDEVRALKHQANNEDVLKEAKTRMSVALQAAKLAGFSQADLMEVSRASAAASQATAVEAGVPLVSHQMPVPASVSNVDIRQISVEIPAPVHQQSVSVGSRHEGAKAQTLQKSPNSLPCYESVEKASYREKILAIYAEHNSAKLGEVDGLIERYAGKEQQLYEGVCMKYLGSVPYEASQAVDTVSERDDTLHAGSFGFPSLGSFSTSLSSTGATGFLQSGVSTLQDFHGAAKGLREKVEKTFDDAIRSGEDTSTLEIMQKATAISGGESGPGHLPSGPGRLQSAAEGQRDEDTTTPAAADFESSETSGVQVGDAAGTVRAGSEVGTAADEAAPTISFEAALASVVAAPQGAAAALDIEVAEPSGVKNGDPSEAAAGVGMGVDVGLADDAASKQMPSDAASPTHQDAAAASEFEAAEPSAVHVGYTSEAAATVGLAGEVSTAYEAAPKRIPSGAALASVASAPFFAAVASDVETAEPLGVQVGNTSEAVAGMGISAEHTADDAALRQVSSAAALASVVSAPRAAAAASEVEETAEMPGAQVGPGAADDAALREVSSDAALASVVAAPQDAAAASEVETAEPPGVQVGDTSEAFAPVGTCVEVGTAGDTVAGEPPRDEVSVSVAVPFTTGGPETTNADSAKTIESDAALADLKKIALANFRVAMDDVRTLKRQSQTNNEDAMKEAKERFSAALQAAKLAGVSQIEIREASKASAAASEATAMEAGASPKEPTSDSHQTPASARVPDAGIQQISIETAEVATQQTPSTSGQLDTMLTAGRQGLAQTGSVMEHVQADSRRTILQADNQHEEVQVGIKKNLREDNDELASDRQESATAQNLSEFPDSLFSDEITVRESYRKKIYSIYAEHNQAKLGEVDSILDKCAGKERLLYEAVCMKYLGCVPDDNSQATATPSAGDDRAQDASFGFNALGSFSASLSTTGAAGFLQSGLSTLQSMKDAAEGLQGAAEGLREKVEKSFDEAIRSEEDTGALELVQKATAKVAKVERSCDEAIRTEEETPEGKEKAGRLAAEAKAAKLSVRAASAESLLDEYQSEGRRMAMEIGRLRTQLQKEQKESAAELKRVQAQHATEMDRAWAQLRREQSQQVVEQEACKRRISESDARVKLIEGRLEAAARERGELMATNQAISSDHQCAIAALDAAERQLEDHKIQADRALEQQKKKLESVELEFAQSSVPYTTQIASLEQKLAKQEQGMNEREAALQRTLAMVELKEAALQKDLQARIEREKQEKQEETRRRAALEDEAARVGQEASRARAALEAAQKEKEAAERKRADVDAQLELEVGRRKAEERKASDFAGKVDDLTKQLHQARAERAEALSRGSRSPIGGLAIGAMATTQSNIRSPVSADAISPPLAHANARELEANTRRLRTEIQALTQQRDMLEQEASKLQNRLEFRDSSGAVFEQKFEAALQMIGRLHEELDAEKAARKQLESQLGRG